MANKIAISITRQFGSLGRPIARRMSELLHIEYYDRDIVEEIANHMGMTVTEISNLEERYTAFPFLKMMFPLGFQTMEIQRKIYDVQTKIINEHLDREDCIVVGRCSDFLMEGHENCVRIFIYAPYEERLRNCVDTLHMSENEAKKMIDEVDRARMNYHNYFAGCPQGDKKYVDLSVNSSLLGADKTAEALVEFVKKRFEDRF